MALDLDNFKQLNDDYGHPYGDEILGAVAKALQSVTRKTDTAARVGGEEFMIVLPGSDAQSAFSVAERARTAISALGPNDFSLSCSAGVAAHPADAGDEPSLCRLADRALYAAKRAGKDCTRRFDRGHTPGGWTADQRTEILALLRGDQVVAHYQPIAALATGRIVGYEALARFPQHSRRATEAWFEQAHATGLGPELEACAIRAALASPGRLPDTYLAVNVSPSVLHSEPLQEALPEDLTGLVIEITEHDFVADDQGLLGSIADLRHRGALIAIDDAGAGYAGLTHLMRVRPDIVKLDRGLTEGIRTDPARMALVESFARFARRIGSTVCAEGIENLDDLATLADLDVEWGQGFALARPAQSWAQIADRAVAVCREGLAQALRVGAAQPGGRIAAGEGRLEHLTARLGNARTRRDLISALGLIAEELDADKFCLSRFDAEAGTIETLAENGTQAEDESFSIRDYALTARVIERQEAAVMLVGERDADPAEASLLLTLGYRSLLMIPVVANGETIGLVEAYSEAERPWTRGQISRAQIISAQFGLVIESSFRAGARPLD